MEAPFSLTIPQSGCAASESPPEVKSSLLSPTEVQYSLPPSIPPSTVYLLWYALISWCWCTVVFVGVVVCSYLLLSILPYPYQSTPRTTNWRSVIQHHASSLFNFCMNAENNIALRALAAPQLAPQSAPQQCLMAPPPSQMAAPMPLRAHHDDVMRERDTV